MDKFNEKFARTPNEVEIKALVELRNRLNGYGLIATGSAIFTAGTALGGICALAAAGFFLAAYHTNTKRKKKGELSVY